MKTALVLEGGAKRGIYTAGVLDVLLENGIMTDGVLGPLSAFAFLVFSLLYTPCVAAIATVKKELGGAYAVFIVALQCIVAWLTAFAVYRFGLLF